MSIFGHERVLRSVSFCDLCRLGQGDWLTSLAFGLTATPVRPGGVFHLVKDAFLYTVTVGHVVSVEFHDIQDSLGVLLLFFSRYTVSLQRLLPFLGQTREFAGVRVETDVSQVHRIVGCRDDNGRLGVQEVRHESKHALFALFGA